MILNEDDSPDSEKPKNIGVKYSRHFVTPSLILFLDTLVVSIGGWLFWLVVSKLTFPSELGIAVTVFSLVTLVTALTQMGLEYPLLKRSNDARSKILGTSLAIEIGITLLSMPIVVLVIGALYGETINQFVPISIALLLIMSFEFVFRFSLLGISNSKTVLIIDLVGVGIKLATGFYFAHISFGAFGLLLAYFFQGLVTCLCLFLMAKKTFNFHLGTLANFKETLQDAIVNAPGKWSKVVIINLSIVFLAFLNISPSDIGIFYIALMITIVVAGFASSMAYMVIPTSFKLNKDLSSSSLRISLSLTAPIVVLLLVIPNSILSMIGTKYQSVAFIMQVLALSIVPSAITINLISMLNNLHKSKMIVISGTAQIVTFFICFFILVPIYGTLGCAISVVIGYIASSILLILFTDHKSVKFILFSCLSIFGGFMMGFIMGLILGQENQILIVISAIAVTAIVIFASKNVTVGEAKLLLKSITK